MPMSITNFFAIEYIIRIIYNKDNIEKEDISNVLLIQNILMKQKEYQLSYDILLRYKSIINQFPEYKTVFNFELGVVAFETENYDVSKIAFEYVLNNSKDAKMIEVSRILMQGIYEKIKENH